MATTYSSQGLKDDLGSSEIFTVTNFVEDFDMDANGAIAVVADTLATLIRSLQRKGIIKGTVVTA